VKLVLYKVLLDEEVEKTTFWSRKGLSLVRRYPRRE
jgi:hypothetical protein